jgi:anti-anti-sigma factor
VAEHPGQHLVVDLDGLAYLDPVTIGVFVGARLQARSTGGDIELVCTSPSVATVFTGSGLDAVFALHLSVADAARSAAP